MLLEQKQLKEDNFKLKRFSRNYQLFKNMLVKSNKIDPLVNNPIVLGNRESHLIISMVISPYCGHCKEIHEVIDRILKKYQNVKVDYYLNIDVNTHKVDELNLYQKIINAYLKLGSNNMFERMIKTQQTRNYKLFDDIQVTNTTEINEILMDQYSFCKSQNIHFTPALYINGYEFPTLYERGELEFFIPELLEDETL